MPAKVEAPESKAEVKAREKAESQAFAEARARDQIVVRPGAECDTEPFIVRSWNDGGFAVQLCSLAKFEEIYGAERGFFIATGPHRAGADDEVRPSFHRERPARDAVTAPVKDDRLASEPEVT